MNTPTRNRIAKLHPSVRNEVTKIESRMIENIDITTTIESIIEDITKTYGSEDHVTETEG